MGRTLIDTTAGSGDTLKAGGDKLNAMTAELYGGVQGLLGGRRARIATIGNSHATKQGLAQAIIWSLWRHYPADVYFDYRVQQSTSAAGAEAFDATKGDIFAVGGSTTTQMLNLQLPRFQAAVAAGRVYDLLYIGDGGYNDQYTTLAKVETGVANIVAVATAALALGVKLVVILGCLPGAATYQSANMCQEANQRLRIFAAMTPGVAFCDVTPIFAAQADTSGYLNRRTGNAYLGQSVDGVHLSGYGARTVAPLLVPYHRAIARARVPRVFGNTGTFTAAGTPSINVLGDAGNVRGTAGLKYSSFNTGVAGVDAGSRLQLVDPNTGNTVATPSIVVGADGYTRQRLTMSGAAAASGAVYLNANVGSIANLNNGVTSRAYDVEAVVELTGVTGLSDLWLRTGNQAATDTPKFGNGSGGSPADLWPDGETSTLFVYSTVPETYAANFAPVTLFSLYLNFTDRVPSGTIDVSRMSFMRVGD